jgi:serine protease
MLNKYTKYIVIFPILALLVGSVQPVYADDGGGENTSTEEQNYFVPEQIIVKLKPGYTIRNSEGLRGADEGSLAALDALIQEMGAGVESRFDLPEETQTRSVSPDGTAEVKPEDFGLDRYMTLTLPDGVAYETSAAYVERLGQLDAVELAYVQPIAVPTLGEHPTDPTPDFTANQGYRSAAPTGIGIDAVANIPGSSGAGIRITDIEYGWTMGHEDLPYDETDILTGINAAENPAYPMHGAAVIGILAGINNGYGITGLVPDVDVKMASIVAKDSFLAGSGNLSNALYQAVTQSQPGDIFFFEFQFLVAPAPGETCDPACGNCNQFGALPAERSPDVYDTIRYATARGITVVEPAGNGAVNLDNPYYEGKYTRSHDSGAIMVAAADSVTHLPKCWTNYGSRIDAYAWGDSVTTVLGRHQGGPNRLGEHVSECNLFGPYFYDTDGRINIPLWSRCYMSEFSGTSSATPIVVGAIASIQGMYKASHDGAVLDAWQIRQKLLNTGTEQAYSTKNIGRMPDVQAAYNYEVAPLELGTVAKVKTPNNTIVTKSSNDAILGFHWTPVENAAFYEMQISNDSSFSTIVYTGFGYDGDDYFGIYPSLSYGTHYYWRVRARHYNSYGGWSPLGNFWYLETDPYATQEKVVKYSPAKNAKVSSVRPTFTWKKVATNCDGTYDVLFYVQRGTSTRHYDLWKTVTVRGESYTPDFDLPGNKFMYWYIKPRNYTSIASFVDTMTKFYTPPATPVLNEVNSGDPLTAFPITFNWQALDTSAKSYQIQFSKYPTFKAAVKSYAIKKYATSWTLTKLSKLPKLTKIQKGTDVVFYWRIKAVGPYATTYSETKSFTVPASLTLKGK